MTEVQKKKYDLEQRTSFFGIRAIMFCKSLRQDLISRTLIDQFVRSATSIGANYMEANGASSVKDFRNKAHICKKEAQESMHWLRMLLAYFPEREEDILALKQGATELVLIFGKIVSTLKL